MTRPCFGWVGILVAFYLLARLGKCSTDLSSFSADYSDCEEDASTIADGVCDAATNTAACGFDGGDCCECTCFVGDVRCDNTEAGFSCEDPDAPTDCDMAANQTSSSTSSLELSECAGYVPHVQDGYCDENNNNAACGFDGGDCCACTCGDDLAHPCGVEGVGFDCQDPDVPSNCSLSLGGCGGTVESIQDSYCDSTLNNAECGYDGGDCCKCTCREFGYHSCGFYGYDCIDPNAPLDCDTDSPTPSPTVAGFPDCEGYGYNLGDGDCDSVNNNLECGWDGGDCCRCTCVQVWSFSCTYFNCLDPSAATDCDTKNPTPSPYGSDDYYRPYGSDDYYRTYSRPTTSSSDDYQVTEDYTEDTRSSETPSESDDDGCQQPVWLISDGECDKSANTFECGWDGGDCCECTCVDGNTPCGEHGYDCRDPAGGGSCLEPTPAPAPEQARLAGTPSTDTSMSGADVGGIISIAVFGFVSLALVTVGAIVLIRRKCEPCVQ